MTKLIPLISILTYTLLLLSGLLKPALHPYIAIGLPLLPLLLEPYWIKKSENDSKEFKSIRSGGVALILGLTMTYMTGFAFKIGLLPKIMHQLCLYPVLIGGYSHAARQFLFSRIRSV